MIRSHEALVLPVTPRDAVKEAMIIAKALYINRVVERTIREVSARDFSKRQIIMEEKEGLKNYMNRGI